MATQEVIDGLTQTIQDCLEAKLQAGFDANAVLTVDIAREVASAVEDKANEYTDIEIEKVMTLITGGEVDLGPFTEFMNTIKTLLDGDETTEGYQVFNTLISDTAANKQLLISHTTTIQSIQNTLTTFQSTLADHETRIAALEAAQHEPMDCEDCHDEILNLVKGSMAAACTGADTTLAAHYTSEHSSVLAAFVAEMNPRNIVSTGGVYSSSLGTTTVDTVTTGAEVSYVQVEADGVLYPTTLVNGAYQYSGAGQLTGLLYAVAYDVNDVEIDREPILLTTTGHTSSTAA